jgi:Uncharacterized conserved protein
MNFAGVDYGSKLAGTTAITFAHNHSLTTLRSMKGADADDWLIKEIHNNAIEAVFIDAPLSLPAAYFHSQSSDFFYRKVDRELHAMSPMFLGGLTARAMRLKKQLSEKNIRMHETYPAALVKELNLPHYKKDMLLFQQEFYSQLPQALSASELKSWHEVDSRLAWFSGHRYFNQTAKILGDEEGLIYL